MICGFPVGEISDDVLTGDNADETVVVVHNGNEVLLHGAGQQIVHADSDADRGIVVIPADDVVDVELFHLPHGESTLLVLIYIQNAPEKVALTDCADILAVP